MYAPAAVPGHERAGRGTQGADGPRQHHRGKAALRERVLEHPARSTMAMYWSAVATFVARTAATVAGSRVRSDDGRLIEPRPFPGLADDIGLTPLCHRSASPSIAARQAMRGRESLENAGNPRLRL
jgi:hypothetical protein